MVEFHVGETAEAEVEMYDAGGARTDTYDTVSGVVYELSHPDCLEIVDEDAEPRKVELRFIALSPPGEDAFLRSRFDGDPGDGLREIRLVSEPFRIVPGQAVSGTLRLRMVPEEPVPEE